MKTASWGGTNISGFSAAPGGSRDGGGTFSIQDDDGLWWSSSSNGTSAWYRHLYSGYTFVDRNYSITISGFSVRCIRDVELNSCHDPDEDGVCAEDEVSGCTDEAASNFNSTATENDGSCTYPGPAQCGGLSTVTFDGHTYALVGIGTQCWFAENLRSDNYLNGDPIPGNLNDSQWASTNSGAQSVYGEGSSAVFSGSTDEEANLATYGRLYNWYAVNDPRGLCPSGFHVPSDGEWMTLEMALGMTSNQANSTGWRGNDQGNQLKSNSWGGTNSSGFSASPGGSRNESGYFDHQGGYNHLWSSSSYENLAWYRLLNINATGVYRSYGAGLNLSFGFSVRCLRD